MKQDIKKDIKTIGSEYTVYNINFSNLTDLYDYLKSDPPINHNVFKEPESINGTSNFYGEPLNKAIEYCIDGYTKGFDTFLSANNELVNTCREISDNRKMVRSLYGGIPLSPLVAAGVPDSRIKYVRDESSVVRNFYFGLSYPASTNDQAIINRGLAVLHIIRALENRGELVNFKAFQLSHVKNEILEVELNLKKPGDLFLDVQKCYFPIKGKEFLRRVLFRVLESVPVEDSYWGQCYGLNFKSDKIREILNTKPTDVVIPAPSEMGITGEDLYEDTISTIKYLNLEKEFDIDKIKKIGAKRNTR